MTQKSAPAPTGSLAPADDRPQWYIFVFHGRISEAYRALEKMNADIYARHHRTLPFFVPAHFLEKHAIADIGVDDFKDLEAVRQARLGNEIRALFRHFVFIKTTLRQIYPSMADYPLLHFYRMASKPVYETEENMQRFIQTCIDTKMHFALIPPLPCIRQNEKVVVINGIWKNAVGKVVKVNMSTKEYTVAFDCFGGTARLSISHFKAEDLLSENAHSVVGITDENRYNFIAKWQRKVLTMTDHMMEGTLKTNGTDYDNYQELSNYGYLYFEKPAMQAKFYALMLLCMTAYKNIAATEHFCRKTLALLSSVAAGKNHRTDRLPEEAFAYAKGSLYVAYRTFGTTLEPFAHADEKDLNAMRHEAERYFANCKSQSEPQRKMLNLLAHLG